MNEGIKRAGPPTTRNGMEWEVVLSADPPPGWLQLFRQPEEPVSPTVPQAVFFRGRIAVFRATGDNIEQWVRSIDRWIAAANTRYGEVLDERRREQARFDSTHTPDKERIRQLNERFKDL